MGDRLDPNKVIDIGRWSICGGGRLEVMYVLCMSVQGCIMNVLCLYYALNLYYISMNILHMCLYVEFIYHPHKYVLCMCI